MEKQKSPAARAAKEAVFPNHLQGVGSISKLFTGAFYHYGHSVEQIRQASTPKLPLEIAFAAGLFLFFSFYFLYFTNIQCSFSCFL
ncbi:hypothetical protein [Cardinium endosymbiont of Philonthus spinipes]|uniref:hypothetical protein n=1 Tax=Cardinium endosymbiont of Philonthus spinipes TaxID=3077941 RepID=UPI00313BE47E